MADKASDRFRLSLTIDVNKEDRASAMAALRWALGRTHDQPGNLDSFLGEQVSGGSSRIRFDTEWVSLADLNRFMRCSLFEAVLLVAELSTSAPAIWQERLTERFGFAHLIQTLGTNDHQSHSAPCHKTKN